MSDVPASELAAARVALDAFAVPADAVVEFVKYRENHVYRVRARGLDRSLRMHRPGYRSDDELRSEAASIAAFAAAGVRVPVPALTPGGDHVAPFVDASGLRRQATMQDWVDGGTQLGDVFDVFTGADRPDAADLRLLGALIARMHLIAAAGIPDGYARAAWDAAGLTGEGALWGHASHLAALSPAERVILERAETQAGEDLADLATTSDRFGVIHADFTFENVLVTDGGLVALDFDDSGTGWYLFDLATPVFWCSRHPQATELVAALLEGYQTVRPLPDPTGWHALLLARGLSYLGWAAQRPGDPTSDFHEQVMAPWVISAALTYLRTGETGWPDLAATAGAV